MVTRLHRRDETYCSQLRIAFKPSALVGTLEEVFTAKAVRKLDNQPKGEHHIQVSPVPEARNIVSTLEAIDALSAAALGRIEVHIPGQGRYAVNEESPRVAARAGMVVDSNGRGTSPQAVYNM